MYRLSPATDGSRVRLATSAKTARVLMGRPRPRRPSQCLRWITAPIGCEPIRKRAPPPALLQRLAYAACDPEWLSSARSSRIAPPLASSSRFIFATRGGEHEAFALAPNHTSLPAG